MQGASHTRAAGVIYGAETEAHRVVLGVEEHHHVLLTLERIERDLLAVLVLHVEGRRIRANLSSS